MATAGMKVRYDSLVDGNRRHESKTCRAETMASRHPQRVLACPGKSKKKKKTNTKTTHTDPLPPRRGVAGPSPSHSLRRIFLSAKTMAALRKRPAAAEPSSRPKVKRSSDAAVACVCSAWAHSGATTLVSLREEIAKSTGADHRDKITVASLSADVSPVLGVEFPNLAYVAAVVANKSKASPQLVSRGVGAKHVFVVGESMCLRHGCRCSLRDSAPIDVLVADGVEDMHQLVAALNTPASAIGSTRYGNWEPACCLVGGGSGGGAG